MNRRHWDILGASVYNDQSGFVEIKNIKYAR